MKKDKKIKSNTADASQSCITGNRLVALTGVFIALALVLSYLESLIPIFVAVPGVKLGIANIVTMIALYKLGAKSAITIGIGRSILSGILFGNLSVIIYSIAGVTLSISIMIILKKTGIFSVVGVSVAGAVFHNVGQLIVAAFLIENMNIMYYMPILIISGAVAGIVVGLLTAYIIRSIRLK